ncbi:MAG: hypothetical protein ABI333_29955 [bacterium]
MPHRAYHLALGVLGLLAVLALVLVKADPDRHAQTGPRWKQRLLTAGLVLLAAFGIGPACKSSTSQKPTASSSTGMGASTSAATAHPATKPQPPYAATAEWKQIRAALEEAEQIAAGKRGSYPFDEKGQRRILAAIVTAGTNADALATRGLLDASEAGLLRKELSLLSSKVREFRPTEMRTATCYEPMPRILAAEVSLKRLRDRLPLLQKMATAQRLHPQVVRKALVRIEADLKVLETPARLQELGAVRRADAQKLSRQVNEQLKAIKIKLLPVQPAGPKSTLEKDARWQAVIRKIERRRK